MEEEAMIHFWKSKDGDGVYFNTDIEEAKNHDWQYHVIDGFIISPNIEKLSINVIDEDFQNSDHNPIYMTFSLK